MEESKTYISQVSNIYLSNLFTLYQACVYAYVENDLKRLAKLARALIALAPNEELLQKFKDRLNQILAEPPPRPSRAGMNPLTLSEAGQERERKATQIFDLIIDLISPIIVSLGIKVREVQVYEV